MTLAKMISGGQTGVDRGALDAALEAQFPCGGWCPPDRAAEDGCIPLRYPMTPLARGGYRERTRQNVLGSDGTAILYFGTLTGGTLLTLNVCRRAGKPHVAIDAMHTDAEAAAVDIAAFIDTHAIRVLNVAGPRASGWPLGSDFAHHAIRALLQY
jgi:hypothetical protein